jgi:hypothetical protein
MGEDFERYKLMTLENYKLKHDGITKKLAMKILSCSSMKDLLKLRKKLGMDSCKKR